MRKQIQTVMFAILVSMVMSGVASAQIITPWANEDPGNGYINCPSPLAAYAVQCQGDYCAEIRSLCFPTSPGLSGATYTTDYYSEEQGKFYCSPGYVVSGFDVSGWDDRGDNISLTCAQVNPPYVEAQATCVWTDWFSEEDVLSGSAPAVQDPVTGYAGDFAVCPGDTRVHGMECEGGWCDNMRLYCCDYEPGSLPPFSVGLWDQCGGNGGVCGDYFPDCHQVGGPHNNQWATCPTGSWCNPQSEWYWQCIPN